MRFSIKSSLWSMRIFDVCGLLLPFFHPSLCPKKVSVFFLFLRAKNYGVRKSERVSEHIASTPFDRRDDDEMVCATNLIRVWPAIAIELLLICWLY